MKPKFYPLKSKIVLQLFCLLTGLVFFSSGQVFAQTAPALITIKGVVTDGSSKETLTGATVTVKGTASAVRADQNGKYSIAAPGDASLVFSYLGFTTKEVAISGRTTISLELLPSARQVKDVVVTALGIKRERRALGYSITEVTGSSLTEARENNFVNGLEGKVAGVNVSNVATGPGGSANVVIRGISDLTGSNQPLYVIDGVPMQSESYRQTDTQGGYGGVDGGDGTININPDDIETISVLKGAAASAIYGYRGSKGVILITTKSGKNAKGSGVEVNSNYVIEHVVDNTNFQTTYGQGNYGLKPVSQVDAQNSGLSSWGAKYDGLPSVQFDGVSRPYSYQKGNIARFYKDGGTFTNSVAFSKAFGDEGSVRFAVSDLHDQSMIPNAGFRQLTFTQSTTYKLAKRLVLQLKAQYTAAYTHNRPGLSDAPGNVNYATLFLPGSINIKNLAPGYNADGSENQFLADPYTTNPYFSAYKFINNTSRNRFIGSADLKYTFDDGLFLQLRTGEDYYADRNTMVTPDGTAYFPQGSMLEENIKSTELNIDAMVGKDFKLSKDLKLTSLIGVNSRRYSIDQIDATGDTFSIPYLYTIGNLAHPVENESNPLIVNKSIYGTFDFAYKNYLYLSATGRNDWYSTLAPGKTNYFYPSVSGSFVFSEVLPISGLDMGKIRVGYANVGGEADQPFQTLLTYNIIGQASGHAVGNIANGANVPNAALRPSSAAELEIGTELDFFTNRLKFDISLYDKKVSKEIIPAVTSETSGYNAVFLNSGTLENKGIEFQVSGTPVKTRDFSWTETFNATYNDNKVLSLSSGSSNYPLGYSRAGEDNGLGVAYISQVLGKSAYQIYALDPARDATGKIILDPTTGAPDPSTTTYKDFGSGISPWTTGLATQFVYKSFNFGFNIDGKFGGKIFSGTNYFAYQDGLSKATLAGRDITYGTTGIRPQDYYNLMSNNSEMFIYNDSFIKLRQVILGYTIPAIKFHNVIQGITISLVARNLATLMKHTPNIDPESNFSNGPQGMELAAVPYTRTYGLNLKIKF